MSGANINGKNFQATNIGDKGISFGENSIGNIQNSNFINNKLAIAVKDGSKLSLSKYNLENNKYDIAVFNKKKEYEGSTLNLNDVENKSNLNILLGMKNEIISKQDKKIIKVKNSYINSLFY